MDRKHDVELDLRIHKTYGEVALALQQAGNLPVVVLPLDAAQKVMSEGRACRTAQEYVAALRWAYKLTPERLVRIIPVVERIEECHRSAEQLATGRSNG